MNTLTPVQPPLARLVVLSGHVRLKPIPAPVPHPRVGLCGLGPVLLMSAALWWGVAQLAHHFF